MDRHSTTAATLDEEAKIRATVLDYIEGWYRADAARMERSLHPELAKRAYLPGPDGKPYLSQMSALELIQRTRRTKPEPHQPNLVILDRYEGAACVRANVTWGVDYMHVVKVGADWKIINVLWELSPEEWTAEGGTPGARMR